MTCIISVSMDKVKKRGRSSLRARTSPLPGEKKTESISPEKVKDSIFSFDEVASYFVVSF